MKTVLCIIAGLTLGAAMVAACVCVGWLLFKVL